MLETVIIAFHVLTSLGVIGFVLIQQGKGAEMGASFGSGASSTVFGSQGSANFLSRTTAVLTAVFFVTSIALAYYAHRRAMPTSIFDTVPATQQVPAGSTPAPANSQPSTPAVSHENLVAPVPAAANTTETVTEEPSAPVTPAPAPASEETTEAPKSE